MAVLCGGPSAERGISLNSARSVLDHIRRPGIDVECFYFDRALRAHAVSAKQMYSNTPSDFDFKLRGRAGGDETSSPTFFPDPASLASHLAARRAVAFPAVHGTFGEDGSLQTVLEEAGVPFGAGAGAAGAAFDKALCAPRRRRRLPHAARRAPRGAPRFVPLASRRSQETHRVVH